MFQGWFRGSPWKQRRGVGWKGQVICLFSVFFWWFWKNGSGSRLLSGKYMEQLFCIFDISISRCDTCMNNCSTVYRELFFYSSHWQVESQSVQHPFPQVKQKMRTSERVSSRSHGQAKHQVHKNRNYHLSSLLRTANGDTSGTGTGQKGGHYDGRWIVRGENKRCPTYPRW